MDFVKVFTGRKEAELPLKYKKLFKTVLGREVLIDLIRSAGYGDITVAEDSNSLMFDYGRKSIIDEILKKVGCDVAEVMARIAELDQEAKELDILGDSKNDSNE